MPFFIVGNVSTLLAFYRDWLGFDIEYQGPSDEDIFFGIVGRGGASIMLKSVQVGPLPNHKRHRDACPPLRADSAGRVDPPPLKCRPTSR